MWSPPAHHTEMAAAIPGSTPAIIPQCGHMAMMEQPAAVTSAMRNWLASEAHPTATDAPDHFPPARPATA